MTASPTITAETVVVRSPRHLATELQGRRVLVELESGKYFALNEVGGFIWDRIERPASIDALCAQVCQEYEVDRPTCESDVSALVASLVTSGLVQVSDDAR